MLMLQAQKMNLAIKALEKLPILEKIKDMFLERYGNFCKSPIKHIELCKLAEVVETKGHKILWNVKTRWRLMLSPSVFVMNEYCTLLMKME
jgi:hypothetical protein